MSEVIYDVFNYSVANILDTYVKVKIEDIETFVQENGSVMVKNSKIYFSSFTGDFQGSILMLVDVDMEDSLSAKLLENFSSHSDVDVFDEILNIIVSQFSNALEYENKKILHSPPIVITGDEIQFKIFKNSHVFRYLLDAGKIEFIIGIKE
jgi:CheY-specific phosphatase CheX